MEHRWNERVAYRQRVTLYTKNKPVEICTMRDISLGGMFIACGSSCYSKYDSIEVEFSLPVAHERKRFRLPALVMYSKGDGIGIMFKRIDLPSLRILQKSIGRATTQEHACGSGLAQPTGQNSPSQASRSLLG